ncbi:MAG: HAD family phosphatase [Flavobacteriales bacterium]|nr:HAD family phosphatase [Flavobacteriales bacterium]
MKPVQHNQLDLIIFDLGGVILNIDYGLTQKAFAALGLADTEQNYSQAAQNELFDALETGRIDTATFRDGLRQMMGHSPSDQALDDSWNALLLDLPLHRLEFIHRVHERYRTCVLSNTNAIHIAEFERRIEDEIGMQYFRSAFDAVFYSSDIGQRKPDKEAFQYVLEHFEVEAQKALFIDDSVQHVQAAEALGLQTIHLRPGEEIHERAAYLIS